MSKRRPALTEEILANVRIRHPGFDPWHKRIPAATLVELEQLRESWWRGDVKSSALGLARQISAVLKRRKLSEVGEQGVLGWLQKQK